MITTSEVTLVFQGYVHTDSLGSGATDGLDLLYNIQKSRESYPDAAIIVSTWDSIAFPEVYNSAKKLGIDTLVLSPDPGGLPNIKFGFDTPNNVNRQIVSTKNGLDAMTTPYAIKLRTDSFLNSANLLDTLSSFTNSVVTQQQDDLDATLDDYSPIVVSSYFSIDPMVYEQMAYHISDWMQFAKTDKLREYWSVDLMAYEDATYFEKHSHDLNNDYRSNPSTPTTLPPPSINRYNLETGLIDNSVIDSNQNSGFTDNTFRTRLAVEQYIATNHAKNLGFAVPESYNHITDDIMADFKRYVAQHIIIADNEQTGFELPKYNWVNDDEFMALNCMHHADWYHLFVSEQQVDKPDTTLLNQAQSRRDIKTRLAADNANANNNPNAANDTGNSDNSNSIANLSNNSINNIVSRYAVNPS